MKITRTAAALAATSTLLASGGLALAETMGGSGQRSGHIHIFVSNTSETKAKILITGAVGDYGTTLTTNKAGKVQDNGTFQRARLQHGTLIVDATGLDKRFAHFRPQVDPENCSVLFTGSGPTKIVGGTGDYAGATGSVKVTVTFAGIAAKTKAGKCNLADNAPTYGAFTTIEGSGTINLGN